MVSRFSTSERRIQILEGFIKYRQALHAEGLIVGLQWIDGSFMEQVEVTRTHKPDPGDIDVVTILPAPTIAEVTEKSEELFDPVYMKTAFMVDAYSIEVGARVEELVEKITYWYGLFSHRRETFEWKGILELDLAPADETDALELLSQIGWED